MSWPHVQSLPGGSIDPARRNTPARKNQRMLAVTIDHGEFQITVERRI